MRLYRSRQRSRTAQFFHLPLCSSQDSCLRERSTFDIEQALRRFVALVLAVFMLPVGQGELLAQISGGRSLNDSYAGDQQAVNEEQSYAQLHNSVSTQPLDEEPRAEPLSAVQLEQLVAPAALYPDALLAQVLAASTYPQQVVGADRWRQAQGSASANEIAWAADAQPWDPSVKALTAFPQVLSQMDRNLPWTTDLGNAYYNQPQGVLRAVQMMRQRAQAAGNLESTPQQALMYDGGYIELAPANPQLVYVPTYNPWTVYGQPVSPYPGFSLLGAVESFFGSSPVRFGLGIAMTAFSHMSWGWLAWGLSWLVQSVLFHQSNYISHSTTVRDWGFPHGGPRAISERRAIATRENRSFRPPSSYRWGASAYKEAHGRNLVPRPPSSYSRAAGNNVAHRDAFVPRPPSSFMRTGEYGKSFVPRPASRYGGAREGFSRANQTAALRYGTRAGTIYNPTRNYSIRKATYQRTTYRARSSQAFSNRGFAGSSGKAARSGFHHFGGSGPAKSFSRRRSYGTKHSGGGSHSGGHSGSKHRR
jgi:Protein of unknown function (DUF3300)